MLLSFEFLAKEIRHVDVWKYFVKFAYIIVLIITNLMQN